jgi:hypothetical protein
MRVPWLRVAIAAAVVVAVVGLAALEMIAARPRPDTKVIAGIAGSPGDWQALRVDAAWYQDSIQQ